MATGEPGYEKFYISNEGGGDLEWEVSRPWIPLNQESGTNSSIVTVTVDTYGLSPGEGYEGNITIESNGGTEEGIVYLNVLGEEPILAVDPDPLDLDYYVLTNLSYSREFEILNEGQGTLEWGVSSDESWITISPEEGTNEETVTVTVDTEGMETGVHRGTIKIVSNGGNKEGEVNLTVYEPQ
ncbi:TPA: BACON domain-containing protein [Methanosarcinaceae archaeon]|nr:BACON domain-containing protein [Methanosarcinaceae archaeon]